MHLQYFVFFCLRLNTSPNLCCYNYCPRVKQLGYEWDTESLGSHSVPSCLPILLSELQIKCVKLQSSLLILFHHQILCFDHLSESSRGDDSNKWPNTGFGKVIRIIGVKKKTILIWSPVIYLFSEQKIWMLNNFENIVKDRAFALNQILIFFHVFNAMCYSNMLQTNRVMSY